MKWLPCGARRLANNYHDVENRLTGLMRNLAREPKMMKAYVDSLAEWEEKRYVRRAMAEPGGLLYTPFSGSPRRKVHYQVSCRDGREGQVSGPE